jgi:hypothetical protein
VISVLMSWALSTIGLSLGAVVAVGLAALIVYFRLPKAWLVTVALVYAGWFYSGALYQAGEAASDTRWQAAMVAEQTRQAAVRAKALDEAVARELARAAENEALEKQVQDYERYLATRPAVPGCVLGRDDVERLRKLQGIGAP